MKKMNISYYHDLEFKNTKSTYEYTSYSDSVNEEAGWFYNH